VSPPPKRWNILKDHRFSHEFTEATMVEVQHCIKKQCFERVSEDTASISDLLPLTWVFTYKTDEDGYIHRSKARLFVRGALQKQWGETYAATLAAQIFRFLIALAAIFDLEWLSMTS
jgi:hypothetical protein